MAGDVKPWSMLSEGVMTLESIHALHQPPGHFRVSRNGHGAGATFPGTMRAGRLYMLAGRASWRFGAKVLDMTPGTWADLPGGAYEYTGLGEASSSFVTAWELPEWLWKKPGPPSPSGEPG